VYFGLSEFFRDAGMALSASPGEIGAVDRRPRIIRRKDAVSAVATSAIGDHLRAFPRRQPVVAGQIRGLAAPFHAEFLREPYSLMAARTGCLGYILRGDWGVGINVRLDGVNSVAVGADRRLRVAVADRLAVDALRELLLHPVMALAAGGGNVEFEDGRLVITRGANFMDSVAVRAHRRRGGSGRHRSAVDALLVGIEGLRAESRALHDEFLTVALRARAGNVNVAYRRVRVARRQNLVWAPVAGGAGGSLPISVFSGDGMNSGLITVDRVFVAGSALLG